MPNPVKLSKADARRALVRHQFSPAATEMDAFHRLRSIQFDPIAPAGCNHDLVLQARVAGYRIGDWEKLAYADRLIYDGWDKQASLVPYEGWPLRRIFHTVHRRGFEKRIFEDHKDAVEAILKEIEQRGPLMPKECEFQKRNAEWTGSWYGPSVTKQTLRALWHSGLIMTAGRKRGQHQYDLTERVVPSQFLEVPRIPDQQAKEELAMERHRTMGIVRPSAGAEIWSYGTMNYDKRQLIAALLDRGKVVPVDVEGMKANSTPQFLDLLDQPSIDPKVVFVGPLDPLMWDRKMTSEIFGFDYVWEIYTPEPKRRWGYYVLPVLYGDRLVARVEFWARDGVLEVRQWHDESGDPGAGFADALGPALRAFMDYCSAKELTVKDHVEARTRDMLFAASKEEN